MLDYTMVHFRRIPAPKKAHANNNTLTVVGSPPSLGQTPLFKGSVDSVSLVSSSYSLYLDLFADVAFLQ